MEIISYICKQIKLKTYAYRNCRKMENKTIK